jgi:hypothetical protein
MTDGKPVTLTGWARLGDYIFGRNTLIGIASLMLLTISGYATWAGMSDFIIGVSAASASQAREIAGGISVTHHMLIAMIVVALTFLMWLALREALGAERTIFERLITFPLYLFLALWSIGFGYGFWWSLIAGEEATRSSLSNLQEDARDAGNAIAARLDAVRIQLEAVVNWSDGQMAREEKSGGSCGTPSGAGRGPLYNARRSVRDSITSLRDSVAKSWIAPVQADIAELEKAAADSSGDSMEDRQKRFEAAAGRIRGSARSIAARSNELGKSTATEMRALAGSVSVAPGQASFACYDPTLAQRLRQAADQADEPAKLNLREAAFNEGPAGVANAIKNLWANIGTYLSGSVRYVLGQKSLGETAAGDPITGRDMIALLAILGVDFGLLALSALNPSAAGPRRQDGLAAQAANLHEVAGTVKRQLRGAIRTAIARAPGADLEWVHRHFIHHNGASYLVIPNLYKVAEGKEEEAKALAMNAGVFSDLKLVRALTPVELRRLGAEEIRDSYSDLSRLKKLRESAMQPGNGSAALPSRGVLERIGLGKPKLLTAGQGLRNHGLLSKAQRALDIAGWSDEAQRDVEVFVLSDLDGLTPLLSVLNGGSLDDEPSVAPANENQKAPANDDQRTS